MLLWRVYLVVPDALFRSEGVINVVSIQGVGRLVKDPDVRYLPGSDNAVAVFSLATSTKYKDKEQSCFVECVVFGKRAEAVGTYLRKGAKVYVRGTLQQDVWEQDGQKRSKHPVS